MRNYITPIIGDMCLGEITPRMMDKYYRDLLSVKAVSVNNRKPTNEYLTPHTVREIHKLLRNAFNQAVRWELIARNPVLNATLPKEEHKEREIWTADMLAKAMEVCDDPILLLALNLAFSCSLRMGEMLGLTWDCVDVSPHSIDAGNASIFVNKELQRVTRGALDDLSDKGVIKKFPPCIASTHTALVLKEPKTKTSIRRVYLPKTVAKMLVDRKGIINLKLLTIIQLSEDQDLLLDLLILMRKQKSRRKRESQRRKASWRFCRHSWKNTKRTSRTLKSLTRPNSKDSTVFPIR